MKIYSEQNYEVFFLKIYFYYFCVGKADAQRGETKRKIFHPMIHSPSESNGRCYTDPKPGASSGSPTRGCRIPKLWAVLDCFPRPQAGSWMGSGAAWIRTGAHMGSWACKARTLTTAPLRWALFLPLFKNRRTMRLWKIFLSLCLSSKR